MARRALLVGAGAMGRQWAKNLTSCDSVELAGWIDVQPGLAKLAADEWALQVPFTGTSLDEAIQQVSPEFVVDVTPPEVHRDVTLLSLSHGIPVLGEKPMAANMDQAREMVEASDKSGTLYMVSQSRRYHPNLQSFKNLLLKTGRIEILNADFYLGPHFGGFRDEMESPLVLDMAIHTFDAARFLTGADPISVYAEEFNPSWSWYRGKACATALFQMSDGLRFTYRGSWCSEGCPTSWDSEWRAVGPNGTAVWDGGGLPAAEVVVDNTSFVSECQRSHGDEISGHSGIEASLREFVNALETGSTPMGECHDNIKSLAMVFAAIRSSREGRRVAIEW